MPRNENGKRPAVDAGIEGGAPAPKASKCKGGKRRAGHQPTSTTFVDLTFEETIQDGESSTATGNKAPVDPYAKGELPYFYRKGLENVFKNWFPSPSPDSDEESGLADPDGFNAAMAIEEAHEVRVETIAHDVMFRVQECEPILVGEVHGKWNIYSPNYLDMVEVADRSVPIAEQRHYGSWKTGTLEIGEEQRDPAIVSKEKEIVGVMRLAGLEYDWRIFMHAPEFVVPEARSCTAIKETSSGSGKMKSEIKVGVYFYGSGLMRMKVPGISLGGNKEMGRWVTLYGVREEV
ncbi:hypothetical protein FB567DRAFT_171464 [Paraphoma chrysanthemicola]|uniref:Uncharacterized protein n=1 Tax=Paraphoma chrysanthemicola TaxID=798071 RepID=A0A8K0RFW0_9PLEO|nr:hypothetical protein FB567DRAFT_171464 [Paraphoma chrysanthemicola]